MKQHSIRVAVVGATGYGGAEVIRLLASHPCAKVTIATSARRAGTPLRQECPWLSSDLVLSEFIPDGLNADFTFLCQETGFAMDVAPSLLPHTRVIDLSADFRLEDLDIYEQYYGRKHTNPTLSTKPVYGLPELVDRAQIQSAVLVANPGCFPTASLLALMPLARAGLVSGIPVVDAKSGVSGAGRSKADTAYLFSELDGGVKAYGVVGHRHTPEIEQLSDLKVRFTPHLIPMPRGIHATVHIPVKEGQKLDGIKELYRQFYSGEPFVTLQDAPPSTKQVLGSNRCAMSVDLDERTGFAIVNSVIDNLVKGMAGQAIQNMNLMAGIPEETGLPMDGVWP
ncbi:MAG: N-acetyl-gamma-glutamyl-phosphate reductase [Fimbriimonas sp.]|nr:N-acetyl-gamma-glutamyl-phosphate reductase [Fimbriimonas sp.]